MTFERELQHADGTLRHTLASYFPKFAEGKVVGFLAVVIDMTETKKMESDRRKLESRLAESARLTALGEMAAGVAHEINNPLAIIKGKSLVLIRRANEKSLDMETAIKDLQTIDVTVDRIAKIVGAMKAYSRNAEHDSAAVVSLSKIIDGTLELCRKRFGRLKIEIRVHCDPSLEIHCRPSQISQVMMNLLGNSSDAIAELESKWIEISCFSQNGFVQIQVTDSGFGIPDEIAQKMMNPFFTTKDIGKGNGLGLSISIGIMESHGGSLKYIKNSGHTSFVLSFPQMKSSSKPKTA